MGYTALIDNLEELMHGSREDLPVPLGREHGFKASLVVECGERIVLGKTLDSTTGP